MPPSEASVHFRFEGEDVTFRAPSIDDHVLGLMRRLGTFYEHDVLERIRERLRANGRSGAAVDAGGYVGTHAVYFARACNLRPVLSFEANPETFGLLEENVGANHLTGVVVPMNAALGDSEGSARVLVGPPGNRGASRVAPSPTGESAVRCTTVDDAVRRAGACPVALVKIDVEGSEISVLDGATEVIARDRPLMCVEIHTLGNLQRTLARLRGSRYWICDCLGYSPTYVLEPTDAGLVRRMLVNAVWAIRAATPTRLWRIRATFRSVAQRIGPGRWEPSPVPSLL